jgi:RNA recognition motif-containing protein
VVVTFFSFPFPFLVFAMANKLFIGSLAWGVTDNSLKDAFAPYGEIVEGACVRKRTSLFFFFSRSC